MTESGARRHPWRVVVVVVGLLVAVNLLVWAGRSADQGDDGQPLPGAIEAIVPVEGGLTSSNSSVEVNLRDDTTGVLKIDGSEIPEDQLQITADLQIIEFRPGEGKEISRFEPGSHTATVEYWPRTGSRTESESFSWDFRVGG